MDDLRNSRFLADSANFAPRARAAPSESRHAKTSVEPLSFEREVVSILLEEPALGAEYGRPHRRGALSQRGLPADLREDRRGGRHAADDGRRIRALRGGPRQPRRACRARAGAIAARRCDTATREERRAHLERVVERLQLEDERRRYRELSRPDRRSARGRPSGLGGAARRVRSPRREAEAISDEERAEQTRTIRKKGGENENMARKKGGSTGSRAAAGGDARGAEEEAHRSRQERRAR